MGLRSLVIGLAVAGVMASSCASAARDAFVEAYNDETAADYSKACQIEDRTLATATDAYTAMNGAAPASQADLVPDYLLEESENWVMTADATFEPAVGGRCEGSDSISQSAPSIGQAAVDSVNDTSSATCAVDKRLVETAVETHFAIKGFDAVTIDELTEYGVNAGLNYWTLETPATSATTAPTVVAVVGGPCDG